MTTAEEKPQFEVEDGVELPEKNKGGRPRHIGCIHKPKSADCKQCKDRERKRRISRRLKNIP